MTSDRIRNIRQNCLFIQVLYAEKLHKYNLIAAATYHVLAVRTRGKNNGYLQIIHGLPAGMHSFRDLPIIFLFSRLSKREYIKNGLDNFHYLFYIFLLFLAVRIRSLISDGNCSSCHLLSASGDVPAFFTAFKAYHAAPNEWSAI